MSGLDNYDAWKTASPPEYDYDDTVCENCGEDLPNEIVKGSPQDRGFCDVLCETAFDHDDDSNYE